MPPDAPTAAQPVRTGGPELRGRSRVEVERMFTAGHDQCVRDWDLVRETEVSGGERMHGVEVLCVATRRRSVLGRWRGKGEEAEGKGEGVEGKGEGGEEKVEGGGGSRVMLLSGCADGTIKEWVVSDADALALHCDYTEDLYV